MERAVSSEEASERAFFLLMYLLLVSGGAIKPQKERAQNAQNVSQSIEPASDGRASI